MTLSKQQFIIALSTIYESEEQYNDASLGFGFIGLHGYKRMFRYFEILDNMHSKKMNEWFIQHRGHCLMVAKTHNKSMLDEPIFKSTRYEIGREHMKSHVQSFMKKLIDFNHKSINTLSACSLELLKNGDFVAQEKIFHLINHLECRNKKMMRIENELRLVDYDCVFIMQSQKEIHDKYKQKIKDL